MSEAQVRVGPYSRRFRRGAIGSSVDGRSAEGRFIRDMERQLIDHVGGIPSVTQRLLIERMIKIRLQLDAFDAKLASGQNWTALDGRTHAALQNAFRLCARELGMRAAEPKERVPSLEEVAADIISRRRERQPA